MAEPIPLPPSQTVTLTGLLIPLFRIAGLIVTLGICFAVDALCRAFFGTVSGAIGWIPYLGGVAQRGIHDIEHKVTSFLGGLENHIDASMGWYLQLWAKLLGQLADGSAEAGWVAWLIGQALHVTRATVHALPSGGKVVKQVTTVIKQTRVIVQRVAHVTKIAVHAAPGVIVRQVNALAGELGHVIEWDIPRLRSRTKVIEAELGRAWKAIRKREKLLVGSAFVGAVAVALAHLGLGWLRCESAKSLGKRVGCGGFAWLLKALEAVAAFALGVLGVLRPEVLAEAAVTAVDELEPLLQAILSE